MMLESVVITPTDYVMHHRYPVIDHVIYNVLGILSITAMRHTSPVTAHARMTIAMCTVSCTASAAVLCVVGTNSVVALSAVCG